MTSAPHIGIDLGTSRTVTVTATPDGRYRPLYFGDSYALPSATYLTTDRTILTGTDALRAGRHQPQRLEPNPKQRIDEDTLLLGDNDLPVTDALAALIKTAYTEAKRLLGDTAPSVTLTTPASWGITRTSTLTHAARAAGINDVTTVAEPVAAAHYFSTVLGGNLPEGSTLIIYDLGAGTFDATAVTRTPTGLTVTAIDIDIGEDGTTDNIVAFVDWNVLVATADLDHEDAAALIEALDEHANSLLDNEAPYIPQYSADAGYAAYPPHPALEEHLGN